MATTPQRPAPPPTSPAPASHPAQPPPARPGVAQPDQQPKPDDPDAKPPAEEKVLEKEEALQLFRAGHRLKKKGDPPEKWLAATRIGGHLVICYPVDEEIEKTVLGQQLVLVPDEPPTQA
jgi:hypothetical protein